MTFEPPAENMHADDTHGASVDTPVERAHPSVASAGSFIGHYQLLHLIGEGGMGQVWLAEQQEPVRRLVALKLIKFGMDTLEVVARFGSERQALALMDHPAIAKVFDAGSTPEGRPYFVMEYVAGPPITTYCDERRMNLRQRLELFIQVCEGVQHAHQKAIIHRDLKPSNILVTEVDGKPVPRIIDFGVAKAMSQGLDAETIFTQAGVVIGTLGYMSPEQADSGGEDIDTRSDVYSLGVVLYELLVGALPLDFRKVAYYEGLRRLRDEDAPRPSTRLKSPGVDSAVTAQKRGTEVSTFVRQLRGDPDSIALKALEKDRTRRYSTPSDLADDIRRFLRNEPVDAHPPSFGYLARKYVRRHRLGVVVAAAGVLLLVGFAVAQTIQLRNTRRQRDRADRITGFMTNMFQVSDPSEARGNTVTAREILDKSSTEMDRGLDQDPAVQAQLMQVMAVTYMNLGLYSRAETLAQRALDIRVRTIGSNDRKTLESTTQLANIQFHEGRDVEAEMLLRKAITQQERILGPEDLLTLESQGVLAALLERQAHFVEAEKIARASVAIDTRKLGADDLKTYASMSLLASALQGQSRFAEADALFRQLIQRENSTLGAGHPYVLVAMHDLANSLQEEGRLTEAEAEYRETLKVEQHVLGPEHPDTANTLTTLANTIRHKRVRYAEAEALYRQSLEIEMRMVGPEHTYTTRAKEGLANVLSSEHRYTEAEQLLREILAMRERVLGPLNTDTLLTKYNLASVLDHEKRYPEAESLMRETIASQSKALDPNDPDTLASKTLLASILLEEKRPEAAEVFARQAFEAQRRILGPAHADTTSSLLMLAHSLVAMQRYQDAATLYTDTIKEISGLQNGDPAPAWYDLATVAVSAGRRDDAFADLHQAIQAGYADVDNMRTDSDLKALHRDPRFAPILTEVQKRSDAAASNSH
jgi:serine/threonine protein kinase/tetratricopeptide (TPR) repeat protein